MLAWKAEHGTLEAYPSADAITNDELLLLECDVLAPCALEQVINADNAAQVKARIVCEGANGPVTPTADEILEDRGVLVLPDVLANAGGVVVSYFEWVQGLQEYFWKEEEVNQRLDDIVTRAFQETLAMQKQHATSMRMAAYGLGVRRVSEATVTRGCIRRGRPRRRVRRGKDAGEAIDAIDSTEDAPGRPRAASAVSPRSRSSSRRAATSASGRSRWSTGLCGRSSDRHRRLAGARGRVPGVDPGGRDRR